ncbi:MFS transporter [Kribbella sp. NPDC055071]
MQARPPVALRSPAFTRLWLGSIISSVGTQMNIVAAAWVLYQQTHSTIPLGIQGLCFSIPIATVPLLAGPIVDRLDPFAVVKVAFVVEAATAGTLAVAAVTGVLHPLFFYAAAVIDACRLAFVIPAQTALTPALVPPDALLSAQSLSMAVWSSSALVGPAVGGLLLASTGTATVFAVNALVTVIALAAIVSLRTPHRPDRLESADRLTDGLRYALTHRWVLALQLVLVASSTLAISAETLLPALAVTTWDSSSTGYGLLRAAPGVAALATGLSMSMIAKVPQRPLRLITLGLVAGASCIALFPRTPTILSAWVVLGVASLALTGTQIVTGTHLQRHMPPQFLGALGGLNAISQSGLPGIGAAATATAAQFTGPTTALTAAVCLAVALTGAALIVRRT